MSKASLPQLRPSLVACAGLGQADLPLARGTACTCRDPECSDTLHSLMLNASHPERVHAAVVQQIKLPHEACVTRETPNSDNIQVVTVPYFMVRHAAQLQISRRHSVAHLHGLSALLHGVQHTVTMVVSANCKG